MSPLSLAPSGSPLPLFCLEPHCDRAAGMCPGRAKLTFETKHPVHGSIRPRPSFIFLVVGLPVGLSWWVGGTSRAISFEANNEICVPSVLTNSGFPLPPCSLVPHPAVIIQQTWPEILSHSDFTSWNGRKRPRSLRCWLLTVLVIFTVPEY